MNFNARHLSLSLPLMCVIGALVAGALAFWLAYGYVIWVFYEQGAGVLDAGWFAGLLSDSNWQMQNPLVIEKQAIAAANFYYHTHISPFLAVFAYASSPLTAAVPAQKTALFFGLAAALYAGLLAATMLHYLMQRLSSQWTLPAAAVATLAAVILCFNQLMAETLKQVHFELWIPILIICFLAAIINRRHIAAAIAFVLLISVREDAGLHLFSILILILAVYHWRGFTQKRAAGDIAKQHRWLWIYCAAGLLLSVILLTLGEQTLTNWIDDSDLYFQRLGGILLNENWVLSILILIAASVITKQPLMLLGIAACIPWVLYNAGQESPLKGNLSVYYGFPLLLVFYWAFACERFFPTHNIGSDKKTKKEGAFIFALCLPLLLAAASLLMRHQDRTYIEGGRPLGKVTLSQFIQANTSARISSHNIAAVEQLRAFYHQQSPHKNIVVGDGFGALFPHDIPYSNLISHGSLSALVQDDIDMILIGETWAASMSPVLVAALAAFELKHHYRLQNTSQLVFSNTALCSGEYESGGESQSKDSDESTWQCENDLALARLSRESLFDLFAYAGYSYQREGLQLHGAAIAHANATTNERAAARNGEGVVVEFQDLPLHEGKIQVQIDYQSNSSDANEANNESLAAPIAKVFWENRFIALTLAAPANPQESTTAVYQFESHTKGLLGVQVSNPSDSHLQVNHIDIETHPR